MIELLGQLILANLDKIRKKRAKMGSSSPSEDSASSLHSRELESRCQEQ